MQHRRAGARDINYAALAAGASSSDGSGGLPLASTDSEGGLAPVGAGVVRDASLRTEAGSPLVRDWRERGGNTAAPARTPSHPHPVHTQTYTHTQEMPAHALTLAWLDGGSPTHPVLVRAPAGTDAAAALRAAAAALGLSLRDDDRAGGSGAPWWSPASLVDWLGPDWEVRRKSKGGCLFFFAPSPGPPPITFPTTPLTPPRTTHPH